MRYLLLIVAILSISTLSAADNPHLDDKITSPSRGLPGKVSDMEHFIDNKVSKMTSNTANIEEISLSNDLKNTRLNIFSLVIAFGSCFATACVFIYQQRINRAIETDNKKERFENRLFLYLDIYHKNIDNILISDIGGGRISFNFIFYEFEMMLREFINLRPKSKDNNLLSYDQIVSITMSFIVNGITRNANMDDRDIVYHNKYENILNKEEYEKLKKHFLSFRAMDNEKLQQLLNEKKHTLILNFGNKQLRDKKSVPWFYGVRAGFIPYVKSVRSIINFIKKDSPERDSKISLKYLEACLSEHELAVLYIFVNSKENDTIKLDKDMINYLVESTNLPTLYRYDKWDDVKNSITA